MLFSYSSQEVKQNRVFYLNGYDSQHELVNLDNQMNWHHLFQKLKNYYPKQNGRPSVDPIILVKILLIQSLEGFRFVRFTCKQIKQNMTYLSLVPGHFSIYKNTSPFHPFQIPFETPWRT
ncbi:transposase [Metabacillus idriensis]|uniref:transposase n=1 Tax=Metabacillus idriensis TaxID=324768 RepID=UPI00281318AA|nr:transposase [Metabacillus idriensis]MDR0139574.1 transposase [Metabacillus idriensis]